MDVEIEILKAFVDKGNGGNPAGVVLNADQLTKEQKQRIAEKAGLSETAFVSDSQVADFKLDFFTPLRQIAHCGHATIATFSYLSSLGKINGTESSKETIDGTREIRIENGKAFMEQKQPFYKALNALESQVLDSLGISSDELIPGLPPLLVNTGNSFVIVPISTNFTLRNIKPNLEAVAEISKELDLIGFYLFSLETIERDATTRMFAPFYGINEEAATGMAAGPLACYLYDIAKVKKTSFLIEQGYFMDPPSGSLIEVELQVEENRILSLFSGGVGLKSGSLKVSI